MFGDQKCGAEQKGHLCCIKCISWSAIVAGALVGIGLNFLLELFGVSIGLTALSTSKEGLVAIAVGGFIGMLIIVVVSMFIAGWVAGYLSRSCNSHRCLGVLYGFTTWCLALVLMVLFASHTNNYVTAHYVSLSNGDINVSRMTENSTTTNAQGSIAGKVQAMVAQKDKETTQNTQDEEKFAKVLGMSIFLTFVLFFVGALASCFGGYCGLKRRGECCDKNNSSASTMRNP